MIMIALQNISKIYRNNSERVAALDGVDLDIQKGDYIAIKGPSGSGKTTLLFTLGAMLRPTRGTLLFDQKDLYQMSIADRNRFRADKVGFIFQMFHLLPYLNVLENVMLPSRLGSQDRSSRAMELLRELQMQERLKHKPSALSTGERQRTAVARALINDPMLVLADEPTGNLDPENAAIVMSRLAQYNAKGGTVIIVTHGDVPEHATRTITLEKGRVV